LEIKEEVMRKKESELDRFGRGPQGPFPWRNARQIGGVQSNLQGAINQCTDGAYVTLDIKVAHNLIDICRQAKHTETNHEEQEAPANRKRERERAKEEGQASS
jgi:hypothetical protein